MASQFNKCPWLPICDKLSDLSLCFTWQPSRAADSNEVVADRVLLGSHGDLPDADQVVAVAGKQSLAVR